MLHNYLDPATNTDVVQVAQKWGEVIQLWLDWLYSQLMFWIYFVQTNFAVIALLSVIAVVFGLWVKKLFNKARPRTSVV